MGWVQDVHRRLWIKIATLKSLKRITWRILHILSVLAAIHEREGRVLGGAVRAQARVWALGQEPRKIRLIECSAKCRYLKKFTCKGTLRQVFYLKGWFFLKGTVAWDDSLTIPSMYEEDREFSFLWLRWKIRRCSSLCLSPQPLRHIFSLSVIFIKRFKGDGFFFKTLYL